MDNLPLRQSKLLAAMLTEPTFEAAYKGTFTLLTKRCRSEYTLREPDKT